MWGDAIFFATAITCALLVIVYYMIWMVENIKCLCKWNLHYYYSYYHPMKKRICSKCGKTQYWNALDKEWRDIQ